MQIDKETKEARAAGVAIAVPDFSKIPE